MATNVQVLNGQTFTPINSCHGKYGSAPLSGVTDPYSRSLYIGCFLPTNLQLMDERQKAFHLRDSYELPASYRKDGYSEWIVYLFLTFSGPKRIQLI
jgi:hypothetical protein